MAQIQLLRTPTGFQPSTAHDEELLRAVKPGDSISGSFKKPRNPRFHNKAFAMLHDWFENQDDFEDFERFYDAVKVRAGLVDLVEMTDKGPIYKLRSLSFASMDDIEFEKTYQALLTAAFQAGHEWVLERYA